MMTISGSGASHAAQTIGFSSTMQPHRRPRRRNSSPLSAQCRLWRRMATFRSTNDLLGRRRQQIAICVRHRSRPIVLLHRAANRVERGGRFFGVAERLVAAPDAVESQNVKGVFWAMGVKSWRRFFPAAKLHIDVVPEIAKEVGAIDEIHQIARRDFRRVEIAARIITPGNHLDVIGHVAKIHEFLAHLGAGKGCGDEEVVPVRPGCGELINSSIIACFTRKTQDE